METAATRSVEDHEEFYIEEEYPHAGDSFFATGKGNWRLNACVNYGGEPHVSWDRYLDGYRLAAEAILDRAQAERGNVDRLVFPFVHAYRHHFALCLKAIIVFGNGVYGESFKFPATHNLMKLWRPARQLLHRRWGDHDALDATEAQLKELSIFDHGSFAYRYPVETDGKTSSHPEMHPHDPSQMFQMLNMGHFSEVASRLSKFLSGCATGLYCELDAKESFEQELREWV